MKIGIIGSGIAGLTAAFQLQKSKHQVTVFERHPRVGMDLHRFSIRQNGKVESGDLPSRMFNSLLWPNLLAFYQELGVEFRDVAPSQSFSYPHQATFLCLDSAHHPWRLANAILNPRLRAVAKEANRLKDEGTRHLKNGSVTTQSLEEYLKENQYSESFREEFLYPTLSSTVFTCSYESVANYPAPMALHALKQLAQSPALLRTRHGTQDVVQRITTPLQDVRLNTEVVSVSRQGNQVQIATADQTERFDHLIMATQANHVNQLVVDSPESERTTLASFRYEDVRVVVHTDPRLMPVDAKNWATFNMVLADEEPKAMCSVWLNRFHDQWTSPSPVFQSINPLFDPEPETIVRDASLQRPVIDRESSQAWQQLTELHRQPDRRIWYVGSYAAPGVPLLESGVVSSLSVVKAINSRNSASQSSPPDSIPVTKP